MKVALYYIALLFLELFLLISDVFSWGSESKGKVLKAVQKLSVPFISNEGQTDERVKFYAKTFGGTLFVTKDGRLVYSLPKFEEGKVKGGVTLVETLINSKVQKITGLGRSITKVNYFVGKDKRKWKTNLQTFSAVSLGEVYKGITLKLRAYGNNVEKIFEVRPGADPKRIALKIKGGKELRIDPETGELVVITDLGEVRFTKPVAYQKVEGKIVYVPTRYKLLSKDSYAFDLGKYDRSKTLIIDPLLASTYIGGTDVDHAYSIAIDKNGNVYVAGKTYSTDFPTTAGAYKVNFDGVQSDAFVSKLSADLTTLIASTYLGGTDTHDFVTSIAIDQNGNVYVAGVTYANDFPTTPGAYQTNSPSPSISANDGFISKLSGDLTNLIASTYLGGSSGDEVHSMTIDQNGSIYVVGDTSSDDFPTTPGAYQTNYAGNYDAFISKLSGDLTTLIASTYLGGTISGEEGASIAIDQNGNVYVAGKASSSDFPVTQGAFQTTYKGGYADAFVSKLNSDLTTLIASTYLGGIYLDYAKSIVLDQNGNVYVTGYTGSPDFPTTTGVYQTDSGGSGDAFVSKLSGDLTTLIASTYIGGNENDYAYSVAIDQSGNIYVAGKTISVNFPTTPNAYKTSCGVDVFVSKLSTDLTTLLASTCFGGGGGEMLYSLAIGQSGDVYVVGYTESLNFPITSGAYQTTYGGGFADAFVAKLSLDLSANNTPAINTFTVSPSSGNAPLSVTFSWNVSDPDGDTLTCYLDIDNDGNTDYTINDCANNTSQQHTYNTAGNYIAKLAVNDGKGGTASQTVNVSVSNPNDTSGSEDAGSQTSGGDSAEGQISSGAGGCSTSYANSMLLYLLIPILVAVRRKFR